MAAGGTVSHMEPLLTVPEVAQKLRIGRSLCWRMVEKGDLPSVKLGRAVRCPEGELQRWIETHTRGGADHGVAE